MVVDASEALTEDKQRKEKTVMIQHNVGIPTTIFIGREYDRDNIPIQQRERADIRHKILAKAAEMFGGVTIVGADGAWVDDAGKVIEERIFQVIVYSPGVGNSTSLTMAEFIRYVLAVSRQTSVLVDDRANPEAYLAFSDSSGTNEAKHA